MTEDAQDEAVLSVRALLSQLLNHKRNSRKIPKTFLTKYVVLWDKMAIEADADRASAQTQASVKDQNSDDVQIVEETGKEPDVVDLDSDDSELVDKELLFASPIPELQLALQDGLATEAAQPRTRIRRKSGDPAIPKLDLGVPNLAKLVEMSPTDINPKTFKEISANLKILHAMKNGKAKKQNKKKKHKPKKAKKTETSEKSGDQRQGQETNEKMHSELFKAFLKREHSKAWKSAKDAAKASGNSDENCKAAASAAGTARTAKLRKDYAEGKINYRGIVAVDV